VSDYYIDADGGDDSTGDGASWLTAWKTIDHAIGSSPAITLSGSGDVVHVKGGIYYGSVSLGLSPTSSSPLTIVGEDGLVEWAAWSNSTTQATSAALEASGKSYVTLKNVRMIGGAGTGNTGSCISVTGSWSDWTVEDCEFIGGCNNARANTAYFATTSAAAINLAVRRCDFLGLGQTTTYTNLTIRTPLAASEYDLNALVENSRFLGSSAGVMLQQSGGTGTPWSTGLRVQQCTFASMYRGVIVASSPTLTTPVEVYGSTFMGVCYGIYANTAGQIVEDGNYFWCFSPRTNVAAGANSDASSMPRFNIAVDRLAGGNPRPFGEPLEGSSTIGAGNYGTPPSVDFYGQTRPSPPSIGALERDTFETPTINRIFLTES
jgi:hypothetical protein